MKKHLGQFQLGMANGYFKADMIPNLDKQFTPNQVNLSYLIQLCD